MNRLEHAGVIATGINISTCRQTNSAADSRANISEDVPEEVVSDDNIKTLRVG